MKSHASFGTGAAISAVSTGGPPSVFQADKVSVGVRSLNDSWPASVTARTCPCLSASRTLRTQNAPRPGFPSLTQPNHSPPGDFCRARHTVEAVPCGVLTAKTSISPLWPSEAVNEVMGDMPYRPSGMGVLSGYGIEAAQSRPGPAEKSFFSPRPWNVLLPTAKDDLRVPGTFIHGRSGDGSGSGVG